MCHWIKKEQDASGGDSTIWQLSKSGGPFLFQNNTSKRFTVNNISPPFVNLDTNWHHIAITYNFSSSSFSLYFDGSLVGTNTISSSVAPNNNTFGVSRIGRDISLNRNPFRGYIGDFRIYNGILSGEQVLSIYQGNSI